MEGANNKWTCRAEGRETLVQVWPLQLLAWGLHARLWLSPWLRSIVCEAVPGQWESRRRWLPHRVSQTRACQGDPERLQTKLAELSGYWDREDTLVRNKRPVSPWGGAWSLCSQENSQMQGSVSRIELLFSRANGKIPPGTKSLLQRAMPRRMVLWVWLCDP